MLEPLQSAKRVNFLKAATAFEASLVLVAYAIGWKAEVDPLADLRFDPAAVGWGLLGTVPLCLVFLLSYRLPFENMQAIKNLLVERLGPLLYACGWLDLLYLGLLAGITEEILFRGLLQPLLEAHWGWLAGLLASNLVFALAHFVTPLYALLAGLTGLYLGLALDFGAGRNLLTPVFIHALYDFLAFLALARIYRAGHGMAF